MLKNRRYVPAPDEILYHYCSPETFHAICSGKALRCSDLTSMNDSLELHWGHKVWHEASERLQGEIDQQLLDDVFEIISDMHVITLPVACCLSTDGDVLSQWRAYAADGTGYAVGFRGKDLLSLPGQVLRVCYDAEQQVQEVMQFIRTIRDVEEEAKEKRSDGFKHVCQTIAWDFAAFKNPAFSEEKEVRFVHVLTYEENNNDFTLMHHGGNAFGKKLPSQQVKFRMKGANPVPYLDMDFSDDGRESPIVHVVLGPKNDAVPLRISVFLSTLGLKQVKVSKSQASYR